MEISLNNKQLQEAIEKATNAAVTECIGGWEVKNIIKEKATEVLLSVSVAQAIESAINNMNIGGLTQAITREIEKAVVSLAVHTLRGTTARAIFDLRKGKQYMTSDEEAQMMEKIIAELKRE